MAKKTQSRRDSMLDWWQTVLNETKGLVDDGIDRFRSKDEEDDNELRHDIGELKQAVADLNAKLDRFIADKSMK
ncbi:MAG: hypothetical protein JWM18_2421 [Chloroflexi bacterium]|jgi:hypothetical protein|nr:hypothetical protein [Chloroflexota bacterium]